MSGQVMKEEGNAVQNCSINVESSLVNGQNSNHHSLGSMKTSFQMFPNEVPCEQSSLVVLSFDAAMSYCKLDFRMEIRLTHSASNVATKTKAVWMNPYTCYFMAPENPSGMVTVDVHMKDNHIGSNILRYQSQQSERLAKVTGVYIRQIRILSDQLIRLGVQSNYLDQMLSNDFAADHFDNQKFLFHQYRYLSPDVYDFPSTDEKEAAVFPTLLHLASSYGFSELCSLLTDLPDAHHAFRFSSSKTEFPDNLASDKGHSELAEVLQIFREMTEDLASTYHNCQWNSQLERCLYGEVIGRKFCGTAYEIFLSDDADGYVNYQGNRGTYVSIVDSDEESNEHIYETKIIKQDTKDEQDEQDNASEDEDDEGNPAPIPTFDDIDRSVATETDSESSSYSIGQLELLELLNKVKNEELSIDDAELLFKEWKLRFERRTHSPLRLQRQIATKIVKEPSSNLQSDMKLGFFVKLKNRLKQLKTDKKDLMASKSAPDQSEERNHTSTLELPLKADIPSIVLTTEEVEGQEVYYDVITQSVSLPVIQVTESSKTEMEVQIPASTDTSSSPKEILSNNMRRSSSEISIVSNPVPESKQQKEHIRPSIGSDDLHVYACMQPRRRSTRTRTSVDELSKSSPSGSHQASKPQQH